MLYNKIRDIAKGKGVPIYRIEEECKFSQGSMCKWNEISPSWDKVQKVADYLKIPINELVGKLKT